MISFIKRFILNKILDSSKIFLDGSIVKYENNKLKVYPSKNTNIEFNGKINVYSDDDVTIQSGKTLRLRGEILHLNDHKPAEEGHSYVLVKKHQK